jgi:hypothetical protein
MNPTNKMGQHVANDEDLALCCWHGWESLRKPIEEDVPEKSHISQLVIFIIDLTIWRGSGKIGASLEEHRS